MDTTNFLQYVLPFGNVTLSLLTLLLVGVVLYYTVQLGVYAVNKTLALDVEDSPSKPFKNPLSWVRLPTIGFFVCKYKGGYVIENMFFHKVRFNYLDNLRWEEDRCDSRIFNTIEEAKLCIKNNLTGAVMSPLFALILIALGFDLTVLLLKFSFLPTLSIIITFGSLFCIRTLAKKFYSGMKKHGERLDGHDKDINELKSK